MFLIPISYFHSICAGAGLMGAALRTGNGLSVFPTEKDQAEGPGTKLLCASWKWQPVAADPKAAPVWWHWSPQRTAGTCLHRSSPTAGGAGVPMAEEGIKPKIYALRRNLNSSSVNNFIVLIQDYF